VDELLDDDGTPRRIAEELMARLDELGMDVLRDRHATSDLEILTMGITFTVYSDRENIDWAWPFDIIPRLIAGSEWEEIEAGLTQRL
jgi:uncharacterized circularly permuted ATP-grasp superfamily protein